MIPAGNRNVLLVESFFVFALLTLFIFEPPDGRWSSELINAVSLFLLTNGVTLILAIMGRAVNKYVEKKGESS